MKLLETRKQEALDNFDNLVFLESLYFYIGSDLCGLNQQLADGYYDARQKRVGLKSENEYKSISAFTSEYEDTDEYIALKQFKCQIEGLQRLMNGIKVRVLSLKAEQQGNY